jgi:hypothetical protein
MQFLAFLARNVASYIISPLEALQYDGMARFGTGILEKGRPVGTWVQSTDGVRICTKTRERSSQVTWKKTPSVNSRKVYAIFYRLGSIATATALLHGYSTSARRHRSKLALRYDV